MENEWCESLNCDWLFNLHPKKKKPQQVTTNKAVNRELCLLHIWEHKHDMTPIQHYDPKRDFCINTTWKHIVLLLILDESGLY